MAQLNHAQLIAEIIATVFENTSEQITGAALQKLLLDFNDSISNITDAGVVIYGGFIYWKGDPSSPVTGDVREGMVGSDLQLQQYNGTAWDIRGDR